MFEHLGTGLLWGKIPAGLAAGVPQPSEKALRDLRRRVGVAPLKRHACPIARCDMSRPIDGMSGAVRACVRRAPAASPFPRLLRARLPSPH
ncbi:hypothetical protein [Kitasatospora sp. NPDC006786]|uniref:hypothetical protein n=1 Tax=unclassified Kitasatospora TaxID=2633591 RepID=UPI0034029CD9